MILDSHRLIILIDEKICLKNCFKEFFNLSQPFIMRKILILINKQHQKFFFLKKKLELGKVKLMQVRWCAFFLFFLFVGEGGMGPPNGMVNWSWEGECGTQRVGV